MRLLTKIKRVSINIDEARVEYYAYIERKRERGREGECGRKKRKKESEKESMRECELEKERVCIENISFEKEKKMYNYH